MLNLSADLAVDWIAGVLPECSRRLAVKGDKSSHATHTVLLEIVLACSGKGQADASPLALGS